MRKQIGTSVLLSLVLIPLMLCTTWGTSSDDELTIEVLRTIELEKAYSLRPLERIRGAIPFPVKSNPFITEEPQVISFICMWILMPGKNEEELANYTEEQFMSEVALIRSIYVAMYEPTGGGPETGVYGLQFNEEVPEKLKERLESNTVLVSGKVAVLVWTDAEDRSCYQAVRSAIEEAIQ